MVRRLCAYICLVLAVAAMPALAQDEDSDGGFLERLIENNLSGEDRDVVIEGFEGLLGGNATFDRLTISDSEGVWLTVTDAELDWNRLALLRSSLVVDKLTAASIVFERRPAPSTAPPDPEASAEFSLPQIPVSIRIDEIAVGELVLGEPLFGEASTLSVQGSAQLAGGEGEVDLRLDRLDGDGFFEIAGSYSNESQILDVSLLVDEAEDGVVVNLLDIPGLPSLRLVVDGTGPISDFAAEIVLATDGVDRLAGRVTTATSEVETGQARQFAVNLGGDISGLFLPQYQEFFGSDVALNVIGTLRPDGSLVLPEIALEARSLSLSGSVELGPDGLPVSADIDGLIAGRGDDPILLPLPGEEIRVGEVRLTADFDAATGDDWTAAFQIDDLNGLGYSVASVELGATGTINATAPNRAVTASLDFDARGVDLGDDAVDAALGREVTGQAELSWTEGDPLELERLVLNGETFELAGSGSVSGFGEGLDIVLDARASADDLSVFSGLAGRQLGGAVDFDATLAYEALTGQFDLSLTGDSTDLIVDQPELDRVLAGEATITVDATRDESGTRLETFRVRSPNATIEAEADLSSTTSTAELSASLTDLGLVLPGLSGQVTLTAEAEQSGDTVDFTVDAVSPQAAIDMTGQAFLGGEVPRVEAEVDARVEALSDFAELVGRPLAGSLSVSGTVAGQTDLTQLSADLVGSAQDLALGLDEADRLLSGRTTFQIAGELTDMVPQLDRLRIENENLSLAASGSLVPGEGRLDLDARLAESGLILSGVEGPATLTATAEETDGGTWRFDVDADGPELALSAEGTAEPFATPITVDATLDLDADDLSIFSTLADRPLGGSVSLSGRVAGASDLSSADLDLTGQTRDITTGIAEVDRLLAGASDLVLDASLRGEDLTVRQARFTSPEVTFTADGSVTDGVGTVTLSAALNDLGLFVPAIPGRVTAEGTASLDGGDTIGIDLNLTGPGGISATVDGTVAESFDTVSLEVEGQAPLGLANATLSPNSIDGTVAFDLTVDGPPALSSVSGRVTTSGARVVLPGVGIDFEGLTVNATLDNGQARLDTTASVRNGGSVSVQGPVSLTPPFSGSLNVNLNNVTLVDPSLYRTSLSGNVSVDGPLAGGATISGDITVGETEINIAGTGSGAAGAVPDIDHRNEPRDVFITRQRAGLVSDGTGSGAGNGGGAAYPLDLSINAPRIFVRGRGLDVEMGGALQLTGTTQDTVPIGEIDVIRGRLNILGSRLVVSEGQITLEGSLEPVLDLEAVSERRTFDDDVRAFVSVTGPVSNPEFQFLSEPSLPEDEVLARLLFGTDLANISALQAAQLASAAATLAGGGPGLVGGLREGLGVDDLDITTDEAGNTAVTAGAYLSDNLYADVTTRSNGETELNLNLDLTERITVTGTTSNTGESSFGFFFKRDF